MAIVYRTENQINKKFYYGVHNDTDQYYLGSGVLLAKAIKKYGRDNFTRRTILEADEKTCYEFEYLMVDDNLINNPNCYNIARGGTGRTKFSKLPPMPKCEACDNDVKNRAKKFCSRQCYWEWMVGKGFGGCAPETRSPLAGRDKEPNSVRSIGEEYGIPSRTVCDWINGTRRPVSKHRIEVYNEIMRKYGPVE